jgi:hypothetical protein
MVTQNDLRTIALSLPRAAEKPHFDRASFRVDAPKGKIFATMPADGATANLMLGPEEQALLCGAEPKIFAPVPNRWGEKGATVIALAPCDEVTLRSALQMAWRCAAPAKLHALLDGD